MSPEGISGREARPGATQDCHATLQAYYENFPAPIRGDLLDQLARGE